jgi:hypothetical protein
MPSVAPFVPPLGPTGVGGFETVIPPPGVMVTHEGIPAGDAVVWGEADPAGGAGAGLAVAVVVVIGLNAPMIAGMGEPSRLKLSPNMPDPRAATF